MPASVRPVLALITGSALVVALGACGTDDPAPAAATSPAATSSAEPPSGKPGKPGKPKITRAPTATPKGAAGDRATRAAFLDRLRSGMGRSGSVHVQLTMTGPAAAQAEGDTTYGPDGSRLRMTMAVPQMSGTEFGLVVVGERAYMSLPGVTPPGKFFALPVGSPVMQGLGSAADGMSPAQSLSGIEQGLLTVTDLGSESVEGDIAQHFRLTVDAAKATRALGEQAGGAMPDTLTYDVWLDGQDRMRRTVYSIAGTSMTIDMTDWGKPVSIQAPGPADLVDAPPGL